MPELKEASKDPKELLWSDALWVLGVLHDKVLEILLHFVNLPLQVLLNGIRSREERLPQQHPKLTNPPP